MSVSSALFAVALAAAAPAAPAPGQPADEAQASQPGQPDLRTDGPGMVDQTAAVQAAYQAAEAMQGPLDGVWRLDDEAGRTLFVLALSDPGAAPAPLAARPDDPGVEGAWRDPNRPRAPDASGFLDSIRRGRAGLSIRFVQGPGQRSMALTLRAGRDGRWTGELAGDGAPRRVVMSRF